jgi:hypothetical protein
MLRRNMTQPAEQGGPAPGVERQMPRGAMIMSEKTVQEKVVSQAQQTAQQTVQAGMNDWRRLMDEQVERMAGLCQEAGRWEKQSTEQMLSAWDDLTRLGRATLEYQARLAEQGRSLVIEAMRQQASFMARS